MEIDPKEYEVLKYRAGNRALFAATHKYLGLILGAIFAIILADPELVRGVTIYNWSASWIIEYYLIIGIVGIFVVEGFYAIIVELKTETPELPIWVKKLFALYGMVGLYIFIVLFHAFLEK